MRYLQLTFITVLLCIHCNAQNIIQDNKGQTSLDLNPGNNKSEKNSAKIETVNFGLGQIKVSTSEKKLELNYYQYFRKNKKPPSFIGVSAAGKVENSVSSALSSGDIAPGTDIKIRYGIRLLKRKIASFDDWEKKFWETNHRPPKESDIAGFVDSLSTASDLWLVMSAGFSGSKFKLFHPDSSYSKQLEKMTFSSPEFDVGFNYWNADILNCVTLVGVTIGVKKSNNFDNLTEFTSEEVTVRTNSLDSSMRKITEKNTVYKGNYRETTSYPVNLDIYFKPHTFQDVAFLLYSHHQIFMGMRPQTKVGAGFYFLRKNNLFDPVFGINIDYEDVFNNDTSDDNQPKWSKLSVGLVADLNTLLFQKRK